MERRTQSYYVIIPERGKGGIVITYSCLFVTHVFRSGQPRHVGDLSEPFEIMTST